MRARAKRGLAAAALVAVGGGLVLSAVVRHGFSARDEATAVEAFVARRLRRLSIPHAARRTVNPVVLTDEVLVKAREHFADRCALCHGNDGRGDTQIGRNLYPKAPDLQAAETQSLSDGELFYIIENGVRLTGMPAWGEGGAHDDEASWQLVYFIRHLPKLTPAELEEMAALNPQPRHGQHEHGSAAPHHRH